MSVALKSNPGQTPAREATPPDTRDLLATRMSTNITEDQIHAVYELGVRVRTRELKAQDAITLLTDRYGMNHASAQAYTSSLQDIFAGREYRRTVNLYATRFFLESIHKDFGRKSLQHAVASVQKHLDYYSRLGKSSLPGTRGLLGEFIAIADTAMADEERHAAFYDQVKRSMDDTRQSRHQRLTSASATPKSELRVVSQFVRNPDVVAEVLLRANGFCERCANEAPFTRAKDGTPYLEVHHKIRLSDGGEDTVENAIALCPNCHRELHFG